MHHNCTQNEDSIGLRRLATGRNFLPKFRGRLFEDEDHKRMKIGEFGHRKRPHANST